jgi:hypothetical protein
VRAARAAVPEGSGEGLDVVAHISRHTGVKRRLVILALAHLRAEEAR